MKSTVNLIAAFQPVKGENGSTHYTGKIDMAVLKKTRIKEIEVALVPADNVPPGLGSLLGKAGVNVDSLLMFIGGQPQETSGRRKST